MQTTKHTPGTFTIHTNSSVLQSDRDRLDVAVNDANGVTIAHFEFAGDAEKFIAYSALVEALRWISRCAKIVNGPGGATWYAISDEKMAEAKSALRSAGVEI